MSVRMVAPLRAKRSSTPSPLTTSALGVPPCFQHHLDIIAWLGTSGHREIKPISSRINKQTRSIMELNSDLIPSMAPNITKQERHVRNVPIGDILLLAYKEEAANCGGLTCFPRSQ